MAATRDLHQKAAKAEPWLHRLARIGYLAKGVIYGLIGLFSLMVATGWGGKPANQADAINVLSNVPLGTVLLILIGCGLAGYALWRIAEAVFDPEEKGPVKRAGYVLSALAYGGVGWAALAVALAGDKAQSDPEEAAVKLLTLPFGPWIGVAISGALFIGGAIQIYNGIAGLFMKTLKLHEMSDEQRSLARAVGAYGLIARGALFGVIGWLVWRVSIEHNPKVAGGIDRAMSVVANARYGPTLLAILATGLISYGIWMCFQARFRRMTPVTGNGG